MPLDAPLRVIPVWCRCLGALVAGASATAILVLIGNAANQPVDAVAVLRLAAYTLLFLCLGVLAGYAAITGLAPSHLWALAGYPCWPDRPQLQLTPDLHRYLGNLRRRHPNVPECWLLEAQCRGQWWILVCADAEVLDALRGDWQIRRRDVHLYLRNEEDDSVVLAWGRPESTRFTDWDWELDGDSYAEFRCPKTGDTRLGQRLWHQEESLTRGN